MFDRIKKLWNDRRAISPLMGIVTLLIGVIVIVVIGSVVLDKVFTSTNMSNTSEFYIADIGSQWTSIIALVFVAMLALVGFFVIRLFGGAGGE
jgi:hypothetical protein